MTTYLIWSDEHKAWWAPDGCGYVQTVREAGRYDAENAARIIANDIMHEERLVPESQAADDRWPAVRPS